MGFERQPGHDLTGKMKKTSGSWGVGGTNLEISIRYLVEAEFVPGVQG